MVAGLATDPDGTALGALEQAWAAHRLAALLVLLALSLAFRVKRPFNLVLNEAVTKDGATMIEHDGVGLARRGPQDATDHLAKQSHLLGRPGEDAAAHFWKVPALSENHAVGEDVDLAGC